MTTVIYPAVALGGHGAAYAASFPDLPGCSAEGASVGELLSTARAALLHELQRLAEVGQDWPEPTPMERLTGGEGSVLLVDVQVEDTPVRVNISIGERLLKRIDERAQAQSMTRSGFIAAAAREALGERPARGELWTAPDFEGVAKQMQEELSAVGRKISDSLGPDSSFSRQLTELDTKLSDTIRRTADSISAAMARRMEAERGRTAHVDPDPSPADESGPGPAH